MTNYTTIARTISCELPKDYHVYTVVDGAHVEFHLMYKHSKSNSFFIGNDYDSVPMLRDMAWQIINQGIL